MTVSLVKGQNVSLTKEAGGKLTEIAVELGWDARQTTGDPFDLDASALMLGANNKVVTDKHFVFFNNDTSPDGSVHHNGDNLTGTGDGADEIIDVNLSVQAPEVQRILFPVTIYQGAERNQNFGMVSNAFIRVVDKSNGNVLAKFDLSEDAGTETCMVFGEVYRHNGEWKFKAIEQGYAEGLAGLARSHGVPVD